MRSTRQVGAALCAAMALVAAISLASDYTPEQQATADFIDARLPKGVVNSDDPHTLLLGAVWSTDEARRAHFLERALHFAPNDPIVLTQANDFCQGFRTTQAVCNDHDWLERLAAADPDNGAPWIAIAARQSVGDDIEGVINALEEAAARPYHDGYFGRAVKAYYRALHRQAPSGRSFSELVVFDRAGGIAAATVGIESGIVISCREMRSDTRLLHLCRKVANQIIDKPSSMAGAVFAAGVLRRVPDVTPQERERIETVTQQRADFSKLTEARYNAWRADPSLIEQAVDEMALHGEYRAWWQ
ncbi:MAG: hypothetical protein WD081_03260 [Gammaproteobacteria bacterium]